MGKYLDEVDKLLKLNKITSEQRSKLLELYTSQSKEAKDNLDTKFREELIEYRDVDVMLASVEKSLLSTGSVMTLS